MAKVIGSLAVALALLAGLLCLVTGGGIRCPGAVPSMTAQQACTAVCGTAHMLRLCVGTLLASGAGAGNDDDRLRDRREPVAYYAGVAARSALDAYAATAAVKREMQYSSALSVDERRAHERCMAGYDLAGRFMSRLAVDLTSCDVKAAQLKEDYLGSLRGMDACWRKLIAYPASPLCSRNLADRNKTMLAALLCSLVPMSPDT